jgi:peroxiredoxin
MQKFGMKTPESLEAEFAVPADFLIDETGKIISFKYGVHADDQWSVDEVLSFVTNQ